MPRWKDLTGQRFGRLVAVEFAGVRGKAQSAFWLCRCDCGSETTVRSRSLGSGNTRSCGCLTHESKGGGRPRGATCSYQAAHTRVRADRGKASYHACVDCGGIAAEWSYDHLDPDEISGQVQDSKGRTFEVTYSIKPEHYSPRCVSCHRAFDRVEEDSNV